jgi:hypothetical protein
MGAPKTPSVLRRTVQGRLEKDEIDLESYTTAHQVIYDIGAGLAVLSQELILVRTPDIYTDRDVDWRSG